MSPDGLAKLLEQLSDGDEETVAQLFQEYAPYLQMVARRLIPTAAKSKIGSEDVVVSVWADVVQGLRESRWDFKDAAHFKAFLLTLTRNRLYDRLRMNRRAMEHEVALEAQEEKSLCRAEPDAEDRARAAELWEAMLRQCPAQYHECLRLRKDGHTYEEIAAQTGYHPGSIRRIMYQLAQRMTHNRDDQNNSSASCSVE